MTMTTLTKSNTIRLGANVYDLERLVLAVSGVTEEIHNDGNVVFIESSTVSNSKAILATRHDGIVHVFHNAQLFRELSRDDKVVPVRMLASYAMKKARV
jgi:hypothetical protein